MIAGIIIAFLCFMIGLAAVLSTNKESAACMIALLFGTFSGIVLVLSISGPEAIDVYRGKTELKITQKVIDGKVIQSDSVVVYK
jgi:hypothetical protein|nr:MAG TPA: hypothetical protein [Caudoviricetes sp.]